MSVVKANTYQDASGGSNAVFSGVASPPNSMGFRNRIINGNMAIDQRNAGASVTLNNTAAYTLDRWYDRCVGGAGSAVMTVQRSSTAPTGFTNSKLLTVTTSKSPAVSEQFWGYQAIEGFNLADFGLGTASAITFTLSFWVRSSVTGTYSVAFQNSAQSRSYVATYTVNAANTFEYKTVTVAGDTAGTWLTDNGVGMYVFFDTGSGSNFNTTAGAWTAGTYYRTSGSVSLVANSGATFYITGVQLEAGSVASPFERVDYGRQLIQCQRYYQLYSGVYGSAGGSTTVYAVFQLPVTMRSGPTASVSNALAMTLPGVAAYTQSSANVSAAGSSSTTSVFLSFGNFSGMTTGNPITMNGTSQFVQLSAEL